MAKILIVEDDLSIAKSISDWLVYEKHTIEHVDSGNEAWDRLRFYSYDLIILDWQLPEKSGLELLKDFRARGASSPVLMLTGKNHIDDKESGLESGADDYLTKPFDLREFSARIKALLRRPSTYTAVLSAGDYRLDSGSCSLVRNGEKIKLMPKEFAVLEFLMRHPNQYFLPEHILNQVWPDESESSIDALRTCIKRLRQKIDDAGVSPIQSSRGCGYKFDAGHARVEP